MRVIDVHDELASALAGRYELERELGHGGMAIVYLARDVKHGRRVAVKVLRPDLASSVGADRFLREIDVAARLTHPNILTLHDSGAGEGGLLYYVMPYVEGETLRDRLAREHQLPIEEALAITRQVADALDYAHAHGVVHRDIKPENILLMGEHVLVADFGLARALFTASSTRITESTVTVGTPAYMSPEQAAADPDVDGRADVYSLACVLYEMVAGVPPFRGATAQAVLAQHLTATPPSLCAQRPHCPKSVDAAVQRAMEKVPADRFRTAREFVTALTTAPPDDAVTVPRAPARPWRLRVSRRSVLLGLAGVLAVTGVILAKGIMGPPAELDPSKYLVLPISGAPDDAGALDHRIAESLGEWRGIDVVDARTSGAIGRGDGDALTLTEARAIARKVGAGRLIWGDVVRLDDSLRLRISAYDTREGTQLATAPMSLAKDRPPKTSELRELTNKLLRARAELPWKSDSDTVRPSLPAWRAYDSARVALEEWDLGAATAELRSAIAIDPDFAQGQLWMARVQLWSGLSSDTWKLAARRSYDLRAHLAPADSIAAEAQRALATGHYPDACRLYASLVALDSASVPGWYGLGECRALDRTIVPDVRSPSGFSFRASMHSAVNAYLHIVDEGAPPRPPFVYRRLANFLFTAGNRLRTGEVEGSGASYGAYPTLIADTLAYVPYPMPQPDASARFGRGKAAALDRNRAILRRLYQSWAKDPPLTADAHAALAGLLEGAEQLTGDEGEALSALAEIRRARALAHERTSQLELARTEVRLLVKSARWTEASRLVDSLFAATDGGARDTSGALVGAAALSGRVHALAAMLEVPEGSPVLRAIPMSGAQVEVPSAVQHAVAVLSAFMYTGACPDSVPALRARAERTMENYIADVQTRTAVRDAMLRIPLLLGSPCLGGEPFLTIDAGTNHPYLMARALFQHDLARVRAEYASIRQDRVHDRPGDVPIDATFIESWILAAAGDTAAAISHLDGSLEALPTLGTFLLDQPSQGAGLVRAMGLRARLAYARHDCATAERWSAPVKTLWRNADPELRADLSQIASLRCPVS
ncbi:MAG TPA: serine/threonine-protein kinase [Gemmatimonadaceae bacterium]